MKNIIIAFLWLIISTEIFSQADWVYFFNTDDGDWYYDRNSILVSQSDNNKLKVWIKLEFTTLHYDKYKGKYTETTMYQDIYYCSQRMFESVNIISYFTDGSTYSMPKYLLGELRDIVPGTVGDALLSIICK